MEGYFKMQKCAIEKTQEAIDNGYRLIRISYLEQDEISEHIKNALKSPFWIYYSNEDLYKYISSKVSNVLEFTR
jgi:hypothetical protein